MTISIGSVRELWRFPVKSMGGERVESADVEERGLRGDRLWAIRDEDKGLITNAKRIPALLMCTARFASEPTAHAGPGAIPGVVIAFPDGTSVASDDPDVHARLSTFVGKRVTLHALRPASDKEHYRAGKSTAEEMREAFAIAEDEPLPDFSMMPMSKLLELGKYATPPGTYFDAAALHVVTSASLDALRAASGADADPRRFRANVVIDSKESDARWIGGELRAGSFAAFVDCPTPRCSMPTRAQPELPADKRLLATLARDHERCLGVYATVTRAGAVRVGDAVTLDPPKTSKLGEWANKRAQSLKRVLLRAAMPK